MKKLTKAVLLSAAGAILIAGGGGTLAAWTSTQSSAPMTLSSGNLVLGSPSLGDGWAIVQLPEDATAADLAAATPEAFDPETDQLVPGDVLVATVSVPVELKGKNMRASLAMTPLATSDGTAGGDALAAAISAAPLTGTGIGGVNFSLPAGEVVNAGPSELENSIARPGTINITADQTEYNGHLAGTVRAAVSFQLPWDADMDTLNSSMNFTTSYTMTQIPKNAAK